MKWNKTPVNTALVNTISQKYDISLLEASLLARRNITQGKDIIYFLEKDFIYLHQPFKFKDMEIAVDRVKEAIRDKEKILIYGDKDVDGITSTTILVRTLEQRSLEVFWRVPTGTLGYGLSKDDVAYAQSEGVTLIITVDCGISNVEECLYAQTLGIDTIIIDHHTPHHTLPDVVAIIDPKVESQHYPFQGLCAAALAQKFRLALDIADTSVYNKDLVLMNIMPIQDSYKFELLCTRNLVVQWRKSLSISKDNADFQIDNFVSLLEGKQIVVYEQATQQKLLKQALGAIDLYCTDLQESVNKYFGVFKDKSLLQIGEHVRLSRYLNTTFEEIDIFFQLYKAFVFAEFPQLKQSFQTVSDLVVIATIADMMPLIGENRILYKIGIQQLQQNPETNLYNFLLMLNITKDTALDSKTIGWKISPIINSTGRMGKADIAVRMLLSSDLAESKTHAETMLQLNSDRKKQMNLIKEQIKKQVVENLEVNKSFVLIYNDTLSHSFTGLVAGQYVRQFGVPIIILANRDAETICGSIRCPTVFNAPELIRKLETYLIDGGGHKEAAGFSISAHNKDNFIEELHALVQEKANTITETDSTTLVDVDLEIPEHLFEPAALKQLVTLFEPYGETWNIINVLFRNVRVHSFDTVGQAGEHAKIIVNIGSYKVPAMLWNFKDQFEETEIEKLRQASILSIVANIKTDNFQGIEQFTLVIQDLEIGV